MGEGDVETRSIQTNYPGVVFDLDNTSDPVFSSKRDRYQSYHHFRKFRGFHEKHYH